tara:strand:- start:1227 stop:3098 length:1872 start_codon:yes stop_codon:yes gene_type:complete
LALQKFVFKPGINKEGTNYSNEGGWFDADKIRFRKGRPEKIGGWEKNSTNSFLGTCRKIHLYKSSTASEYVLLGTHKKLYAKQGTVFHDITPVRSTTGAGDVTFAKVADDDATITVNDTAHGAVKGDFVTFTNAATLGGNITDAVLNQEYEIATIVTPNSYTIEAKDTSGSAVLANSSDTGSGGSSTVGAYQTNTGLDVYVRSSGWGATTWGAGGWGSDTEISLTNQLRLWSIDNFGDDVIAAPRYGELYYWDESSGLGTRAVPASSRAGASNTPVKVLQIMMSDVDRHVIAFGCNPIGSTNIDPLLVRFSDSENAVDWTPTATNSAGGVKLSQGSTIVGALQTRQEILIWTDVGIVSMRFVGQPFIFSFNEVATGMSMASPNAAATAGNIVYFMDNGAFYQYAGSAQRLPCTVLDHVFGDINQNQIYKIFAAAIPEHNEIIWFYPSASSTEIDRYVIYNYLEQSWSIGTTNDGFVRTAWNSAYQLSYPIAASKNDTTDNNYLYNHEFGHSADGSTFNAFIESSDFDLDPAGEKYMLVSKIIPDLKYRGSSDTGNTVTFTIKGRDYPLESLSTLSTVDVTPNSTFTNIRARSRQSAIRIEDNSDNFSWRLGDIRLELRQDGRR